MFSKRISYFLKSRAVKQGSTILFDQGMMSLLTFVSGILMARASTAQDYALYMLGWSLLHSVRGIHDALVDLPFTVYTPRLQNRELALYKGSTLVHTAIICLIVGIVALITEFLTPGHAGDIEGRLLQMGPLLFALLTCYIFRDFFRNALFAQFKIWESVRINGSASLLLMILIYVFYHFRYLTPANAYQLFAVTFALTAAAMFWQHRSDYGLERRLLWKHFLKNCQIGLWALVGNFAYIGSRVSYPWLILYFLNGKSVAAYYACLAIALAPAPFLRASSAYILPRMSHSYKDGSARSLIPLLRKSILYLGIPYIFWLLCGIFFSEEVIKFFYNAKYHGYGLLFILLLIMATIDFVFAPLTSALQVLEKTRAITVSLIIGAVLTLPLGSFLIERYGLYGAGIASIISMVGTIGWRIFVFTRNAPQPSS